MRSSISEILGCTNFAGMGSSSSPPPITNGTYVNGANCANHEAAASNGTHATSDPDPSKPTILHLGAEIHYNPLIGQRIASKFNIIRPTPTDLLRDTFIHRLETKEWGDFDAIMKPFWRTGSDMHPWDAELIQHLPGSMKVMAAAGAGFDWVDAAKLAERGTPWLSHPRIATPVVETQC